MERGAVAAHQVTAAPPGALGARGVCGDAARVLLQGVEPAVHGDPDEPLLGGGLAQGARSARAGRCERGRAPSLAEACELRAESSCLRRSRPPARPSCGSCSRAPNERSSASGAPSSDRGVRAQDDGAGGALLVLAGAVVEDDGGNALAGEGQGEREPDGARADDDHRVHGARSLPARGSWGGYVRNGQWSPVHDHRTYATHCRCLRQVTEAAARDADCPDAVTVVSAGAASVPLGRPSPAPVAGGPSASSAALRRRPWRYRSSPAGRASRSRWRAPRAADTSPR